MSAHQQPRPAAATAPVLDPPRSDLHPVLNSELSPALRTTCPSCGGSGMLRLGDQRFRTCLDCLGQGQCPTAPAATTVAAVLQLDSRRISAAASSAAAR